MSINEKELNRLLEIEKKYEKSRVIAERARKKREALIRLKLRKYEEGVESGVITSVTEEEIKREMK